MTEDTTFEEVEDFLKAHAVPREDGEVAPRHSCKRRRGALPNLDCVLAIVEYDVRKIMCYQPDLWEVGIRVDINMGHKIPPLWFLIYQKKNLLAVVGPGYDTGKAWRHLLEVTEAGPGSSKARSCNSMFSAIGERETKRSAGQWLAQSADELGLTVVTSDKPPDY